MKTIVLFGALLAFGNALPKLPYRNSDDDDQLKLVGGVPAKQGEFIYQLALWKDYDQHCGAVLIKVKGLLVGLTAAHCTIDEDEHVPIPLESFTVVGGDLIYSDTTGLEQEREVAKVANQESYNNETDLHDIVLLFFDKPFEINTNVAPIRLPEAGQVTTGTLTVSGWGNEMINGSSSDILQKVEVPVVDDQTCADRYRGRRVTIYPTFLCAGVGGKDSCEGDSGGPAVSNTGGYLAGIVSVGLDCGHPKYPGIYTEVSHYIHWINKNVDKYIICKFLQIPLYCY